MRPAPRLCAVLLAVACHDEVRCGDTVTGDAGTEPAEFECVRAGPADHVEPPDMSVLNCAELTRCMGDCVGGDVEACRNACTTDAGTWNALMAKVRVNPRTGRLKVERDWLKKKAEELDG